MQQTVGEIYKKIMKRLPEKHIINFEGIEKPVLLISETYPGVWLEHVYDSVIFAKMRPEMLPVAVNTINLFIDRQTEEGQLPCYIWDGARLSVPRDELTGYGQIQECVSFHELAMEVALMTDDNVFLRKIYTSGKRWVSWLNKYRMTRKQGLVEAFVGHDIGHDNSGRYEGMKCKKNRRGKDGKLINASAAPEDDDTAPIFAADMNSVYFATLNALSKMAHILKIEDEAKRFSESAVLVKKKMFELLYDRDDAFFYDADKNGKKRKYLSSSILHLFLEGVLDVDEDKCLIDEIYNRHIKNPKEFWTKIPFPSMALCDKTFKKHTQSNCWGYFSEALIALRATRWMDKYGFSEDFDKVCRAWLGAWTEAFDKIALGQEFDPITGEPSDASEWYSSAMLFYVYAAKRLNLV